MFLDVSHCLSRVADEARETANASHKRDVTAHSPRARTSYLHSASLCSQKWIDQRMDYKARRRYTAVTDVSGLNDYPHDIQMYDVPPVGETSLEEFQELGFDRLKGKDFSRVPLLLCTQSVNVVLTLL